MGAIRNALRPVRIRGSVFVRGRGSFGIWGDNTGPDSFKHFIEYTAEPRLPPGQDLQFSYLRALCAFVVKSVPGVPGVDGVDGVSKGGPYSPHP
jgi:hypothetical protein